MYLAFPRGRGRFPQSSSIPPWYSGTRQHGVSGFRLRVFHPLWMIFPDHSTNEKPLFPCRRNSPLRSLALRHRVLNAAVLLPISGLGFSPFARRYLGNQIFFLFLRVLRCFTSPGIAPFRVTGLFPAGFPHSATYGSTLI